MGLVDYSDSESESEVATTATPAPTTQTQSASAGANGKKPFQKVVDRSKPGKIQVNLAALSGPSAGDANPEEPPAKRARINGKSSGGGGGGGAFSGFNSFLPAPKNAGKKPAATAAASSSSRGVGLKTGAAPGFSRNTDSDGHGDDNGEQEQRQSSSSIGGGMSLPPPKSQQPTIPEGQKPAEEVKLVGKPLMFKPLSVSRKPGKKATTKTLSTTTAATTATTRPAGATLMSASVSATANGDDSKPDQPPAKKKISLFSISDDPTPETGPSHSPNNNTSYQAEPYEPLFPTDESEALAAYDAQYHSSTSSANPIITQPAASSSFDNNNNSLQDLASTMNLSKSAQRELFGRNSSSSAASSAKIITFDTEREYAANEAFRHSAEGQAQQGGHNPVRAIAPGKHSLRQLVSQVQNQRDALEESFAQGRANQREAGSRYGWR